MTGFDAKILVQWTQLAWTPGCLPNADGNVKEIIKVILSETELFHNQNLPQKKKKKSILAKK